MLTSKINRHSNNSVREGENNLADILPDLVLSFGIAVPPLVPAVKRDVGGFSQASHSAEMKVHSMEAGRPASVTSSFFLALLRKQ